MITVAWLIVDIPQVDSRVIRELTNYILEVLLVGYKMVRISDLSCTWGLHPLRIVYALNWSRLGTELTLRVPAIVKHHEHGLYIMTVGNT